MKPNTPCASILLALLIAGSPTAAQSPVVNKEPEVSLGNGAEIFHPANYGIVEFDEPKDLFERLTASGRCPVEEMAAERQPCAFVFYELVSGEGRRINFKPVFKVESNNGIWVMHDKKLRRVSAGQLYNDSVTIRGQTAKYRSFAVVGNSENAANCEAGRRCLADLVEEDMFLMYKTMPGLVVEKLWHNHRSDPGTNVIVRQ